MSTVNDSVVLVGILLVTLVLSVIGFVLCLFDVI